ncbi:MAG: prephenate dehydrogenase [Candidatus Marisimplicoccus sp.]
MKVGIVGLGLLGGSIGLKLKDLYDNITIYGYDIDYKSVSYCLKNKIIDVKFEEEFISELDFIFLAIPVDSIKNQLSDFLNKTSDKTLIIDLGSTKFQICNSVENNQNRKNYLAAHPIAGTEFSGPNSAKKDLFNDKVMILCDTEKTDPNLLLDAKKIIKSLGMSIKTMNSKEHDKYIAYVSHLSHISSFMLGKTVMDKEDDEHAIYNMAGSGFESTVRLAKSSPEMWSSIFVENKKNIIESLDEYISNINNFKKLIEGSDQKTLNDEMRRINGIKKILKGIN